MKYDCIFEEQFNVWQGKPHLDRRRKHQLSASPGAVHQVAKLLVVIVKPATIDHWANDVGYGAGSQQAQVKGFSCRYHNRKCLQSTTCLGSWCRGDKTYLCDPWLLESGGATPHRSFPRRLFCPFRSLSGWLKQSVAFLAMNRRWTRWSLSKAVQWPKAQ